MTTDGRFSLLSQQDPHQNAEHRGHRRRAYERHRRPEAERVQQILPIPPKPLFHIGERPQKLVALIPSLSVLLLHLRQDLPHGLMHLLVEFLYFVHPV